jgi:hypothetical protein
MAGLTDFVLVQHTKTIKYTKWQKYRHKNIQIGRRTVWRKMRRLIAFTHQFSLELKSNFRCKSNFICK